MKDTPLGAILERQNWERHFLNVKVDEAPVGRQRSRSPRRGGDDARGANDQVQESLRLVRQLQSKVDQQANEIRNMRRRESSSSTGNKGAGKNANGKGQRKNGKNARANRGNGGGSGSGNGNSNANGNGNGVRSIGWGNQS